jgi:excisionase family DNA binding protein
LLKYDKVWVLPLRRHDFAAGETEVKAREMGTRKMVRHIRGGEDESFLAHPHIAIPAGATISIVSPSILPLRGRNRTEAGGAVDNNCHQLIFMSFAIVFGSTLGRTATRALSMDQIPDEVFTIDELASYLKIPKSTLYKVVREGKVPCQKIGRHWRFGKTAIDRWLQKHQTDDLRSPGGS